MTSTSANLTIALLKRQIASLLQAMDAIVARSHNIELGTSKVIDMRRIAERSISGSSAVAPLMAFRPTHRHRKGGLYRLLGLVRVEADLSLASIYEPAAVEEIPWSRPAAEFNDGRFTVLEAAPGVVEVDPVEACISGMCAEDLVSMLGRCRPDLIVQVNRT